MNINKDLIKLILIIESIKSEDSGINSFIGNSCSLMKETMNEVYKKA